MRNNKGFTLVELVIVVILIGILAALALPRFLSVTDSAHEKIVAGSARTFKAGLNMTKGKWNIIGQSDDGIKANPNTSDDYDVNFTDKGWINAAVEANGGENVSKRSTALASRADAITGNATYTLNEDASGVPTICKSIYDALINKGSVSAQTTAGANTYTGNGCTASNDFCTAAFEHQVVGGTSGNDDMVCKYNYTKDQTNKYWFYYRISDGTVTTGNGDVTDNSPQGN